MQIEGIGETNDERETFSEETNNEGKTPGEESATIQRFRGGKQTAQYNIVPNDDSVFRAANTVFISLGFLTLRA